MNQLATEIILQITNYLDLIDLLNLTLVYPWIKYISSCDLLTISPNGEEFLHKNKETLEFSKSKKIKIFHLRNPLPPYPKIDFWRELKSFLHFQENLMELNITGTKITYSILEELVFIQVRLHNHKKRKISSLLLPRLETLKCTCEFNTTAHLYKTNAPIKSNLKSLTIHSLDDGTFQTSFVNSLLSEDQLIKFEFILHNSYHQGPTYEPDFIRFNGPINLTLRHLTILTHFSPPQKEYLIKRFPNLETLTSCEVDSFSPSATLFQTWNLKMRQPNRDSVLLKDIRKINNFISFRDIRMDSIQSFENLFKNEPLKGVQLINSIFPQNIMCQNLVCLSIISTPIEKYSESHLLKILKYVPNLRIFQIENYFCDNHSFLNYIYDNLPKLESLNIKFLSLKEQSMLRLPICSSLMLLSGLEKLKKLRYFHINAHCVIYDIQLLFRSLELCSTLRGFILWDRGIQNSSLVPTKEIRVNCFKKTNLSYAILPGIQYDRTTIYRKKNFKIVTENSSAFSSTFNIESFHKPPSLLTRRTADVAFLAECLDFSQLFHVINSPFDLKTFY